MDRTKWEYKSIGESCVIEYGKRVVQQRDGGTIYPVYGGGGATFFMDTYNRENRVVISRFAMSPLCTRKITGKFFLNDSGLTIRSKIATLSQQYLDTCILSINDKIYQLGRGVAQKNLKVEELLKISIPIPSHTQQINIVAELDKLNEVIALKRKQLADLDSLAQSLFYEMFGDPVENEKGWEVKKLGEVFVIGTGSTPDRKKSDRYYGGGVCWVKTTEVHNCDIYDTEEKITDIALKETNCSIYPIDTILMAMYGQGKTRGQIARLRTEAATNQACAAIIPNQTICDVDFLYQFLHVSYEEIREIGRGGTQPNMNLSLVKSIRFPLPPLPLQQSFAAKVAKIEAEKQRVKASLKDLETLLASRMQYWFDN